MGAKSGRRWMCGGGALTRRVALGSNPRAWVALSRKRERRTDGLRRLQLRFGVFVVRQIIDPVLQIVRTNVAEIEVVAVLPYVTAEERLPFSSGERIGAIRRARHLQLAVRSKHQPHPA